MSLKNIIKKSIASTMALSILFGNCSLCGMGLIKVIAEDLSAPEVIAQVENEKYVQFKYNKPIQEGEQESEEVKGVAIQSKLTISPNYNQDTYLPIESVELEVNLPSLSGYLPEKASVVEAKTKFSTGEELNKNINQNYDSDSGLLTVSYKNIPNEEEQIYSEFNENAKDEFEIIYLYPEEAYIGNEDEIKLAYTVNTKATFKTEKASVTSKNNTNIELKEKENKGDILSFRITDLKENVYKGFLYSNVQNKTNYDTEYKTVSTLSVLNNQLANELTMELKESDYILNDEAGTKVSTNGKVVYKSTKISKYEFDRMLGQDGVLEIYNGETLLATIKYVDVNENKKTVKKLAVIYSEEDIRILEDNSENAVVEYPENITSLNVKTSKPTIEGFINFENQNVIKASEDYGCKIEDIKYIRTQGVVNDYIYNTDIQILEPETKISVTSSNTNFSTLQTSKTTITVKLDDTNASTKLFDNPIITVKLPEGLIGGNLSSPEIVNGNGLKIKKATAKGNVIAIELEGKQTTYDLNNVSGGVSIVMDIENIDFDDTLPTHLDKIEVSCTQGKETIKANCNVNIASKYGLLNITEISDENISIEKNITKKISMNENAKEVSVKNTYVNNYENSIKDFEIIGTIPTIGSKNEKGEDLESTFNTKLFEISKIEGKDVDIYYSEEINPTSDSDTWKKDISDYSNIKSYKIVSKDSEFKVGEKIVISYKIRVPQQLSYNQKSYGISNITYNFNKQKVSETYNIVLETERLMAKGYERLAVANNTQTIGELEITSYVKAGEVNIGSAGSVYENQFIKYGITVKNITSEKIEDITIKSIIPENATYVKFKEDNYLNIESQWYEEYTNKELTTSFKLKSGETAIYEYYVRINSINENRENVKQSFEVINNNKIVKTIENINIIKKANIQAQIMDTSDTSIKIRTGQSTKYAIKVKNVTDNNFKNIALSVVSIGNINTSYKIYNENDEEINKIDLKAGETKILQLYVQNNSFTNSKSLEENLAVYFGATIENETYYSNVVNRKIYQDNTIMNVSLTSNNQSDSVYDGTEIIYTIKVSNVGVVDADANILFNIPYGLKMTKLLIASRDIDETYPDGETSLELFDTTIKTKETLEIIVHTKVDGKNAGVKQELVNETEDGIKEYETTYYDIEDIETNVTVEGTKFENISSNNIKYKVIYKQEEVIDPDTNIDNDIEDEEIQEDNNLGNMEEDKSDLDDEGTTPNDPENPNDSSNTDTNPENPDTDNPSDKEQDNDNKEENEENKPEELYSIIGVAWLDSNKDGKRDENEKLQQGVVVTLVNKQIGNFALDANGNKITTTTDSNGKYEFSNLSKGNYIVLFEFDTNTYTVTTYQKNTADDKLNSDVIMSNVKINGENKLVAITDSIDLSSNKENIDIGLIENAIFDLSLEKTIIKTSVINSQGTEEHEYEGEETAKVDLVAKYINTANVVVTYKFTVTNNGEVTGYVDSLVDDLPSGLEFDSDLNKDWYKGNDGRLYTTALSGISIKPGESKSIELVLTKNMTEDNVGVFPNNAELEKISNLENIQEREDALENNKSSAMLVISIKTGSIALYTGITLICILIITLGTYFIKKKVLNRGI